MFERISLSNFYESWDDFDGDIGFSTRDFEAHGVPPPRLPNTRLSTLRWAKRSEGPHLDLFKEGTIDIDVFEHVLEESLKLVLLNKNWGNAPWCSFLGRFGFMIPRIHSWMGAKNAFMLQQFSGNLSNWASSNSTQSVPGTWKQFPQNVDQPRAGLGWSSPVCNIPVSHPAWNVQIARAPSTRSNTGESNSFSFESLKDISYKAICNAWDMLLTYRIS